jgi:deazaflavin-dependent oxidoreductase (nitroreductase family)
MWYNPIIAWILRSPLHGLLGGSLMVVTYRGRKSGKVYHTPVSCVRDGDTFLVTSFRKRTWWRNLRGGVPVSVRVRGRGWKTACEVVEDGEGVAANLMTYLREVPQYAQAFDVALDADDQPNAEDVARAAQTRVMIRIPSPQD